MKKRLFLFPIPILAVVLELLPGSVIMKFATVPGALFLQYCSYFDMLPVGYANFGPMLTGCLTVVLILLAAIFLFVGGRKLQKAIFILSVVAAGASVLPLLLSFSPIGGVISLLLIGEAVLSGIRK